jgi:hypothetical protein
MMETDKNNEKINFTCPHCQYLYEMLSDYLELDKMKLALRDGKTTPEAYCIFLDEYNERAEKRIRKGDRIIHETEMRFALRDMKKFILKKS